MHQYCDFNKYYQKNPVTSGIWPEPERTQQVVQHSNSQFIFGKNQIQVNNILFTVLTNNARM